MKRVFNIVFSIIFLMFAACSALWAQIDSQSQNDIQPVTDVIAFEDGPGGAITTKEVSSQSSNGYEFIDIRIDSIDSQNGWQNAEVLETSEEEEVENNVISPIENILAREFRLYPNPVSTILNIEFSNEGAHEVMLYDLVGKLHLKEYIEQTYDYTLDLSDLSEGIYLLQFSDGDEIYTKRVNVSR